MKTFVIFILVLLLISFPILTWILNTHLEQVYKLDDFHPGLDMACVSTMGVGMFVLGWMIDQLRN